MTVLLVIMGIALGAVTTDLLHTKQDRNMEKVKICADLKGKLSWIDEKTIKCNAKVKVTEDEG